ncbi:UDP-2,3-diacylglucosamine diphosphatase [Flavilitoribacter nigricans]|uniref:UDP-2,3-diacylglucosamine hydrolase n=1 Tax=Flavilitoribacter nigricans (strain ATCC 23147 / DSM 23189 / NBRC 102662 / NCIMB 1420 / SS-2) TaxID=1122177 RepID=A0A2D0MYD5_FLAN2|nr:UDP-2,3-diacylglucosamine diphosphatase [Flavilitoribacter nigricans]PHN01190.1 UDP-2,3-diacylglucosamine hydrolase [Flavilitoribacter nigricans DSM 23189 = NBRC 102662]
MERRKTYFASDFHLGINGKLSSREREQQIVRWLEHIEGDAEAIYLVGDVFDFWFEYRTVVPRGFTRLLGKLATLRDQGIPIYFFTGNHDMWVFDYFEKELGIPTYREPIYREINGRTFLIGHGDGLGPGDHGYKFLKKVFANPVCQWLFARLHPNFGFFLAQYWSGRSRSANPGEERFLGAEREWLLQYSNEHLDEREVDYFIFGHRHLPIDHTLKNGRSRYINLGEWLQYNSYAVFDGEELELRFFEQPNPVVYGNKSETYVSKQ